MRVFVAGSTGALGRRVVSELTERGHEVVGLTRDRAGDRVVERNGGTPERGDLFDPDTLRGAMEGCAVAVRVATAVPTGGKTTGEDWAENDRIRREGTENLLSVAAEVGVERYYQESVVWVARRPDGGHFEEDADPNPDRTTRSALDAEELATAAGEEYGVDGCTLRLGWLYGHDAVQTRSIAENLLAGRMPVVGRGPLGRGDAELSVLHLRDAASAFAAAVESDLAGLYHVVDDCPVTLAAFLDALADRLGADSPRRIPWWLARPLAGKDAVRFFTTPFPTTNDRFRSATGWEPAFENYESGLDTVVRRWADRDVIRERGGEYEWVGGD